MIKVKGTKLIVDTTEFDLAPFQGKKVTVFKEYDGSYTIESKPEHYLSVCELEVPLPIVNSEETGEIDDLGAVITKEVVEPLVLSKTAIKTFKEVA
jgi:hypothetical protein